METKDIIRDIQSLEIFNKEEISINHNNDCVYKVFKSWEFYQIFYLSNSDLYYLGNETEELLNSADEIHDTELGRVYCFS